MRGQKWTKPAILLVGFALCSLLARAWRMAGAGAAPAIEVRGSAMGAPVAEVPVAAGLVVTAFLLRRPASR